MNKLKNEYKSSIYIPLSNIKLATPEQPGPPVIHNIRGSRAGLLWDSMK